MPRIALVGGSLRAESVSERVLHAAAALIEAHGANATVLTARELQLPLYDPGSPARTTQARAFLAALRSVDGLVLATPTYHGGMSGLLKNALDYVEDLAADTPPYLDGRAVGCVAVGWSEHGAATAVEDLRGNVTSLRGWATPMGVTVNALASPDVAADPRVMRRLDILVSQVLAFAHRHAPLAA